MKKVKKIIEKICTVAFLISVCICSTVFASTQGAAVDAISLGVRLFSAIPGVTGVLALFDAFSKKGEESGAGQSQFKSELAKAFILLIVCIAINLKGKDLIMSFISDSTSNAG